MSEVKRHMVILVGLSTKEMVLSEHFDRVTAERDAALNDAESLRESLRTQTLIINSIANARDALQQRLTAADERADLLEGLLREWLIDFGRTHSGLQRLKDRTMAELRKIDVALKPAEGGGDGGI